MLNLPKNKDELLENDEPVLSSYDVQDSDDI